MKSNTDYSNVPYFDQAPGNVSANKNRLVIARLKTPFGDLLAGATVKGICLLEFTDTQRIEMQLSRLKRAHRVSIKPGVSELFAQLNDQLEKYFAGNLKEFCVPLDVHGTDFQLKAWRALESIPYGETRSYQEQAMAIENPKAIRAVASANRNNKISIIIPCHRVIGKNGQMAGYGGGIWRKEYLLNLEAGTT